MDTRAYIWLARNLYRYNYLGESVRIREAIQNLNINEESIRNDAIRENMDALYAQFVQNFGNNIMEYKTGLIKGAISANDLDCYFISSAEGKVPIGFYRSIRPVETAIKVQQYIRNCQIVASESENEIIEDLQERQVQVKKQFDYMQHEKSPNWFKAISGGLLSIATLVFTIIVLLKMNIGSIVLYETVDLSQLWLFKDMPFMWGALFLVLMSMTISIISVVGLGFFFTIKEIILIKAKKNTKDISQNMEMHVESLQQEAEDCIYQCKNLLDAAGRSESVRITKHVAGLHLDELKSKVEKAENFVTKTRTQRRGNDPVLLYTLLGSLLTMVLFSGFWLGM